MGSPKEVCAAACFTAAIVLLAASAGRAEPPPAPVERPVVEALRVEQNACFDATTLAPHVRAWIGHDGIDRRIAVELRGAPDSADGLQLTVLRDGRAVGGRRFGRLDVPCTEVRAAVGLAIAVAIDATLLDALAAPPPAPAAPRPPPADTPPRAPPPPAQTARRAQRLGASVDVIALLGALPSPALGVAPSFELLPSERIHVRIGGLVTTSSKAALAVGSVSASILAARVDVCPAFFFGQTRLRACAGVAGGRLAITGAGYSPSYAPSAPWVAPILRVDLRLPLASWIGVVIGVDGFVPVMRARLDVVDEAGNVTASELLSPAGAAFGFGPEVLFW